MDEPPRTRWDRRYTDGGDFSLPRPPRELLTMHSSLLTPGGLALDAAAGLGDNSAYLLEKGLRVVAVDISGAGIRRAAERLPGLMAVQGDLSRFSFARQSFNVILNFYYLERSLFKQYKDWLKPGGVLFLETLTLDMLEIRPELPPEFLLRPGELAKAFHDWEILFYREGWQGARVGRRKATASLLARRP